MLVPQSAKHHPEFDLAAARRVYASSGHDKNIDGELITSPHHLFSVETLRDRLDLRVGRAVAADVFVFGKGEPPCKDCTQVGGNPYWPSTRAWPSDAQGKPYRFLAQINFADSKDLFPDLPGELLMLFVGEGDEWLWGPDPIYLEWVTLQPVPLLQIDRSLIAETAGPFYGAIHRSADYPDAQDKANDCEEGQAYNLPILSGTKIGGAPHAIQAEGMRLANSFASLAQFRQRLPCRTLGSIILSRSVWAPIATTFMEAITPSSLGIWGSIAIFRNSDGSLRSHFETY